MRSPDLYFGSTLMLLLALFLLVLLVCWIVLPFAVIGTKDILRDILAAMKENNRLNRELLERMGPPTQPMEDSAEAEPRDSDDKYGFLRK